MINVAILMGGKSTEHEVSLLSAQNVISALDRSKFNSVVIKIEKSGKWMIGEDEVVLAPECKGEIRFLEQAKPAVKVDVVFPVLHGTNCEDGTIQGLLKLANVPFVGASVLGSAVGMDKDVMKRLLRDAGIPIGKFLSFQSGDSLDFAEISKELGLPIFVKPANLGSSVGISKVSTEEEFAAAVKSAFEYDTKIICEENIMGREIECSVLGNRVPIASIPGEVIPAQGFYSYEAKYTNVAGTSLAIPAELNSELVKAVQEMAIKVFSVLCCQGLGRVDFFLKADGQLLVNEINTLPGFTSSSMYPKLWEASGIGYTELITRLVDLAFERYAAERKLKTSFV